MAGRIDIKLAFCSILIILVTHGACQGDCSFRFQLHPKTNLNCNPYHNSTLLITCLAAGPLHSALQVVWLVREGSDPLPKTLREENSIHSISQTRINNSKRSEQLVTTTLRLNVDSLSKRQENGLCVWCQIKVPSRILTVSSNQLCIKGPRAYSGIGNCSSQQVVNNSFIRVCAEERSIELSSSWVEDHPSQIENTLVVMSTPQLYILSSQSLPSFPSTPFGSHTYTPYNTPSAYIEPGLSIMQYSLATTSLLPSPTKDLGDNYSGSMLSNNSLTFLYAAVVVCVVLAAVIMVLVVVMVVLCRRRRRQRKTKSRLYSHKLSPNILKSFHNRPQLSFSGSECVPGEVPFTKTRETRCGSETEALKGSIDTRSSGSQDASVSGTEKNSPLSRRNSDHKYTEIDTISRSGSTHSKMSLSLYISNSYQSSSGNVSVPTGSSHHIPPPPNTRGRNNSTPHFYHVLERPKPEAERKSGDTQLKSPWELGLTEGNFKNPRSQEGNTKDRSGSLKRGDSSTDASLKGSSIRRSRSGSYPSREQKGGSLKRAVRSREGSLKSSRSHEESVKQTQSTDGNRTVGRDGSIKSRGSREGSFKKEVWVPVREQSNEKERKAMRRKVPPLSKGYDRLEPKNIASTPYSIINESYFRKKDVDSEEGLIFDDPKYAAVSVGDLPRHMNWHQSMDPIIPRRMQPKRGPMDTTDKSLSSKSLQDSGLGACGVRSSIYQTRGTTPTYANELGMTRGGHTPSRLSMPFEAYYS